MPRNYRKEYDNYQSKPEQRKRNDARKKSRRKMVKAVGKSKLRGKDIDHKDRNPHHPHDLTLAGLIKGDFAIH